MYLQLGLNVVVPETEVIGIFDLDNTTGSYITRKFLGEAEKAGRVVSLSDELPNSFVVCDGRGGQTVYLSVLSTLTLQKRSGKFYAG